MHLLVGSELVVLGAHYNGMHTHRMMVRGELDGELRLGVRPQVRHHLRLVVAYIRQDLQQAVGERKGEGHVVFGVTAGVAEHHALVAGALLLLNGTDYAAVDVGALLVDGADDAAAGSVETVFGLGVAYAGDGAPNCLVDIHVGIVGADLASNDHQSGGAESLAGNFGIGVLGEEFVQDSVGNLIGHFVGVALGD